MGMRRLRLVTSVLLAPAFGDDVQRFRRRNRRAAYDQLAEENEAARAEAARIGMISVPVDSDPVIEVLASESEPERSREFASGDERAEVEEPG